MATTYTAAQLQGAGALNSEMLYNNGEFNAIKMKSINLAREFNLNFSIGDSNDLFSNVNPCPWPWESLYVSTEGLIVPCCVIGMPETLNMGSIIEMNLAKIWNSKQYRNFRKKLFQI